VTPVEYVRGDTSIREATRTDLLDVLRIEQSVFPQPWPYSAFERHVDAPGFLVSECRTDGESDAEERGSETAAQDDSMPFDAEVLDDLNDDEATEGNDAGSTERSDALGDLTPGSDSITGYVVADNVHNHGRPLGHVKNLAVHPSYRNEGVGSALLERSLSVLAAQGAHGVKLEVRRGNDGAIALYRSFGFEYMRTLTQYYADGEDALLFVANLEDRDAF
jgi:ribosomal-protein-alanine N-acetyltransferase